MRHVAVPTSSSKDEVTPGEHLIRTLLLMTVLVRSMNPGATM